MCFIFFLNNCRFQYLTNACIGENSLSLHNVVRCARIKFMWRPNCAESLLTSLRKLSIHLSVRDMAESQIFVILKWGRMFALVCFVMFYFVLSWSLGNHPDLDSEYLCLCTGWCHMVLPHGIFPKIKWYCFVQCWKKCYLISISQMNSQYEIRKKHT